MSKSLIKQLEVAESIFAGMGLYKAKQRLATLSTNNQLAKAYLIALDIEYYSIMAKKYRGNLGNINYQRKHSLISQLMKLCEINNWSYGKKESDIEMTANIIFFDLPNCEQISFHTNISNCKDYNLPWDGKYKSTILKLDRAIRRIIQ